MAEQTPRIHTRPLRAVTALRVLVLLILAGFALALVFSYGRHGAPQTEISMAPSSPAPPGQGPVVDKSDRFEINGTREGRPAFTLQARTMTGFAGDRKLLEGVRLTIHDPDGGTVTVDGVQGQFDAAARRAQLTGDVVIATEDGLSLKTGTLFYDSDRDMIFTADEIAFTVGGIEGEGRGLNYLVAERQIKIPDQVHLRLTGAEAGRPTEVTSGDLLAALREDAVVFTDDVRLTRGGDRLRGNYLRLQFDAERKRITHLRAFGEVVATLATAPDGSGELRSDSLTARFSGPGEVIEEAEASGGCRFTSGPYTSRSRSARYVRPADRVELRGDPVVLTGRDRIAAQEIDVHPQGQTLEARGDVRTVSLPGAPGDRGSPGFSARSATSFQARELRADQAARRAVYSGSARAWQEGNSLQAEEIVVDQAARQLRGTERVMGRWSQRAAGDGAAGGRPVITSITARSVVFEGDPGVARFRGDVQLSRPEARMTADTMDAYLKEKDGRRDLDRVEANGSVALKRDSGFGTGHEAEYRAEENLLVLKDPDGLAEVVDAATGRTLRGRTLTFDLAGDRILTESERGGRTWITLKPESKDVQPVEPQTSH
jgi:LPS export ABC transporter protein LptC